MDTISYVLNTIYILEQNINKLVNYDNLPSGMNAIVAIACYKNNQEDSII